jgi:hypothetical protein
MSRRTRAAAEQAAQAASEAARTLAQRSHEARQESQPVEPAPEGNDKPEGSTSPDRVEKLLNARPHVQAMDDLRKRRGEVEETVETPEKPAEAVVDAKVEPKEETPAEAPPVTEVVSEAPKTVRVKVDGEEYDVPAEEVEAAGGVTAYQKDRAAENRLKKTNAALEETRKVQAQMAEWLQNQAKVNQKPEPSDAQFIQERIDKMRFGTAEEASQAQLEILQRINKPVDQDAIIEAASIKIRRDAAVDKFKSEFADIIANPVLLTAAVSIEREEFAKLPKGQVVDFDNLYRKIGNQIRSAFGRQSQPATTTDKKPADTTSPAAEKEARKASIVNLPTASARAEGPKVEKELTPEEERRASIAAMKKARGQA